MEGVGVRIMCFSFVSVVFFSKHASGPMFLDDNPLDGLGFVGANDKL